HDLRHVEAGRRAIRRHHAVAERGRALERAVRRVTLARCDVPARTGWHQTARDENAWARRLHRPRHERDLRDPEVPAFVREPLVRPEARDDLEHLVHPAAARLLRHLDRAELLLVPADPDAEDDAAAGGAAEI